MNLLEEKGVSNEFVDKLANYSTKYEHGLYVNLLEKLQKFASNKWFDYKLSNNFYV